MLKPQTSTEALSRDQLDLLIRRLKVRQGGDGPSTDAIPRRGPDAGPAPLSPDQERLWFLHRLDPASPVYNLAAVLHLLGPLDRAALTGGLRTLVERHESLCTRVEIGAGGEPVQAGVRAAEVARLPQIDVSRLPPAAARAEARRLASDHARRPFDLARGPLARFVLVDLGDAGNGAPERDRHDLLIAVHHLVADGWSIGVFLADLRALYQGFGTRTPPDLEELPVRFADFAAWKRERLRSNAYEASLAYWRERLSDAPELELPADRPRPAQPSGHGRWVRFEVPGTAVDGLRTLARRSHATPFMAILAAFHLLVARWTGERHLVVGSVVAGRERPELEGVIGFFANTLALRTDLSGASSFRDLLERVRGTVLEALRHQELPFAVVVGHAGERPAAGAGNPFFRTLVALENRVGGSLVLPGLHGSASGELEEVHTGTAKFDLSLLLHDSGDGIRGGIEYSTELFDRSTVLRVAGHLRLLLEGAVSRPEAPPGELPWLSPPERQQVIEWNAGAERLAAAPRPVHARFQARARASPDAAAIAVGDRVLTYGELSRRATRLAHALRRQGVAAGALVGLCVERSPEMVAAILGILEAGGAYLPLDPELPADRLAFMIGDAGAALVLVAPGLEERLAALEPRGVRVLRLDGELLAADPVAGEGLDDGGFQEPDHLAYVIYTSGSTGRPKGSSVTHANVARLLDVTERWIDPGPDDVWTLFHSYAFDFSVWELWGALAYGGRLEIVSYWLSRSPDAFRGLLLDRRVTVLNQTPTAFKQLLSAEAAAPAPSATDLRCVVFGGEALEPVALSPWVARHGDRRPRLVNMYGITETTVHVTYRPVTAGDLEGRAGSPIGRPLPDLAVHLLDRRMDPVPLGVAGEIHVGGPGLARGYLRRPALTAERFVPDPFAPADGPGGRRLYKAGDLARRLPDGELDFLGRIDQQVKVRGFRIELGEIEAVLSRHPSVAQAAVVAREEPGGGPQIAAYVVRRPGGGRGPELRSHCARLLPEYMVPTAWVELDTLPLTSNGKLDRRALPAPAAPSSGSPVHLPARDEVELAVARTFEEVLGARHVGRDDDFFDLGGHSLLAARVAADLERALGVELPVRTLFEHPTVAGLARAAHGARGRGPGEAAIEPLPPREREQGIPLSFAQQRLWFLEELRPGGGAYTVAGALRLRGPLHLPALAGAFGEVVRRHEVLRTVFRDGPEGPLQVVLPWSPFPLPVVDLRRLPAAARDAAARGLARRESARPFDLARGPLVRALAVRSGVGEHVLVVALHHIVSDGWSMGVLVRELGAAYGPLRENEAPRSAPLAVQYGDYAAWQRRRLTSEALEPRLAYWRERLAGAAGVDLPSDRPRPAERSGRGGVVRRRLEASFAAALGRRCREEKASLFMVLLAGLQALVGRLAGQDDVMVGTPVANRTRPETESLIGFFVNTLVLRADLSGEPTLGELVARAREATLAAYARQDVPFERVVEELAPARDLSRTPLFQVMLALQNVPLEPMALPDLHLEELPVETGTAKFDLTLDVSEVEGGLAIAAEYDSDLFDRTTIERLLERYRRVLAAVAERPAARLAEVPLLAPVERHQLLVEWQGTPAPPGARDTLVELFAFRAATVPDAVAVTDGRRAVSYGELERRSRRLAHRLAVRGVAQGHRVAVCLERSPDLVAALLGVLRAGGAYVPLDPSYPSGRLAFMLEDSGAAAVVSSARAERGLAPGPAGPPGNGRLLLPDALRGPGGEDARPLPAPAPGDLAYLIYTSGSTGRPKGVAIEHRSAAARVRWALGTFGRDQLDGVLASTSVCFDLSIFELFVPLASGGRIVLVDDALALAGAPEAERATLLNTVPSAMAELLRLEAVPRSLRVVNLAGEPLRARLVERIRAETAATRVLNLYGPSEDTTYSTWAPAGAEEGREPPIGRPLDGTRAYVLDAGHRPVPPGVPGELHLGGAGVSRGYHARPGLTAERYLPDPFADGGPGARLYRTGDLARHLPDGRLEFLGRRDHQVKLRGFRLELGEVEAALAGHRAVNEGAVAVVGEGEQARLAAWVELRPTTALRAAVPARATGEELRRFLRERLPAPMVPSVVGVLEALPRSPNGKVDRRALAARAVAAPATGRGRAPEGALEAVVARLFREVLDLPEVGAGDDFFELGGHSLLTTRLTSRLRRTLGVEVYPRDVFAHPTVRGLAAALALEGGVGEAEVPPLARSVSEGSRRSGVRLSFAQERLWFLERYGPGTARYSVPGGLRLLGSVRPAALARALRGIVARHEALRTRFVERGGEPLQRVEPRVRVALPVADLSGLPEGVREGALGALARREASRPFDLGRAPLVRALLVRLGPEEHALVVVMHHIVSDGWSFTVLAGELAALYEAAMTGGAAELPELAVQYADYAVWQRGALSGSVRERELAYWRERLSGVPPLELPGDRARPAVPSGRGEALEVALPAGVVRGVESLCRGMGASPFHVLMAAFQAVLARWSGQGDFGVGTPVANRPCPEAEALVGFFVNTVVLRARPELGGGFGALVERVREASMEALGHQDLPLELVVEALAPEREAGRTPLFQVVLGFWNEPAVFELSGVRVEPFEVFTGTSKFDLTLTLRPSGEGIRGALELDGDRFDRTTGRRLWRQLETLLVGGLAEPGRAVEHLPLLTAGEHHQVVAEWAGGSSRYPREATLPDLFARQAGLRPEAVAVAAGGVSLSYGELAARARALGEELRALGVGPEVPVGLLLERSVEMVVATLAVLEAGGCYVPLDADYPRERVGWMLEDTAAPVVLAHRRLAARLGELFEGPGAAYSGSVLFLDDGEGAKAPAGEATGEVPARLPESAAYVMYTSGSTGRPKGVAVAHRAVARLVLEADFARLGPEETFLQLAPTPFDAATLEIWGPLLTGGRLVVMAPGPAGVTEVGRALERERVTTLWLTAGLFQRMVEEEPAALGGLRQLLAGGDVLSPRHVRRVLRAHPGLTVINGYGPTENTTFTACFPLRSEGEVASPVPIGRPIADTGVLVLDRELQAVPVGTPGDLYAVGDGLARGYANRPGATAAAFLPHPGARVPGARAYRTGDLARWRADGTLEFLGRRDRQLKLRGFRVEPGEVEAALAEHPGLEEAVVVVRRDAEGDPRLVAYAVPAEGAEVETARVRDHLRERLPAYMVPSAFVFLDQLPLDPNGKVDRRALPEPPRPEAAPGEAPRTGMEAVVAHAFGRVLDLDPVPLDESFFELGGHSLQAARAASLLRRELRREVPLRLLFAHPTVRELAGALALEEGVGEAEAPPLARSVSEGSGRSGVPLSFSQERLWFLERYEPGSAQYSIPGGLRLSGELSAAALARALSGVVARHEALRTRFEEHGGEGRQRVEEAVAVALPVVDLSALPERARAAALAELGRRQAAQPFDLGRAPLLRSCLARLAPAEHALVVVMHHIVSDGWSLTLLARELSALYGAAASGRPAGLPELAVQYPDYAVWQRRALSAAVRERELAYWREQLAGVPALELPADRPRPAVRSGRGETIPVALAGPAARGATALGRGSGASTFPVLMAAFQAVLARWSGQEDFAVGTPVANRPRPETEGLVGFFVNTLVLRARPELGRGFEELVRGVRDASVAALNHQELPLELVVEALAPERDPSRTPLFQVVLGFLNEPAVFELPGLSVEPLEVAGGTAKFDLTLNLRPEGEGIAGALEFSADLFDRATALRLWRHLATLLGAAVAAPERPVASLPLLAAGERHQVVAEWAGGRSDYPRDATLAELFARQVRRRPDAVAVELDHLALTYGELARRAGRVAAELRDAGVTAGAVVGLCFERGPELVAATLGVLHAGAAYLPLDPSYPPDRLAFMIEDSGASVVLAAPTMAAAVPGGPRLLVPAKLNPAATAAPSPAPAHALQTANVIYTSGSTGRPKGVMVTHRGIVRLVVDDDHLQVAAGDRVGFGSNIAFDAATLELWSALANGGCLVGIARDVLIDPPRLAAHLAARRLSVAFFTTALFNQVAREEPGALAGLRAVGFGGEAADPRAARAVLRGGAPGRLLNLYGPAENATLSTWHRVAEVADAATGVPIGRAVANSTVHVLGRGRRHVPVGVQGELFVGGDGLAAGYLRRPGLTAERFVPNAFSAYPGERLYATGDLVRRRPADGALEFLGRGDHQVKIRGFRIEPDEVASVLAGHQDLAEAVVVVREDSAGERRLVAYVTPRGGAEVAPAALTDHLRRRLPAYMVPSAFVLLDRLPLDPNGKVDRRALPEPPAPAPEGGAGAAPRNPVEEAVATAFAQSLGVPAVGRDDDFFKLGGHSLLGVRVAARLRELLGVEVPLRLLFESPTPAELAGAVATLADGDALPSAGVLRLAEVERRAGVPLSFAQERLWILERLALGGHAYAMPFSLRLRGRLDPTRLAASFSRIVERHEALRTVFRATPGGPRQVVLPPHPTPLPVADLAGLAPAARGRALDAALARLHGRRFDLERGPLFRTVLLREGPELHALHLAVHHAVSDGWSLEVLVRELAALYGAAEERAAELPELPVQYGDYAAWQRAWLSGERRERQLVYWRERLEGVSHGTELPPDRPRGPAQGFRGGRRGAALPADLKARLEALARREDASLFMVLLAGFQGLLSRLAGEDDVVVGSPVAGRERPEVQPLIGLFLNTLVLRTDVSGAPPFRELVGRVRETALGAYAHQDVPFEAVIDALEPERDLSRTPLFQVFFNMYQSSLAGARLPGLELEAVEEPEPPSKFDLTLYLTTAGAGLAFQAVYNADLFEAATVERLLDQYLRVLEQAAARPEAPVTSCSLVLPECRAVLPDPRAPLGTAWHGAIHEALARRAAAAPERVAVADPEGAVTYGELAGRAARLAGLLRRLGLARSQAVAVYAHRSAPLAWAVPAVLEAGGVFLMLDPAYPAERLVDTLEQARRQGLAAFVVLAEAGPVPEAVARWLDGREVPRVTLSRHGNELAAEAEAAPEEVGPDDPAVLGFTSGSTGRPKGIVGRHGSLTHFLPWQCERFGLTGEDRFTVLSGLAHDPLQRDLFTPIWLGAAMAFPEPDPLGPPAALAGWIARERLTVAHLTPALGQVLAQAGEGVEPLASLRRAFLVGDALTVRDVERLERLAPGLSCVNLYGSTETQRAVAFHEMDGEQRRAGGRQVLPLGRGMDGAQLVLLNAAGGLCAVGEVGEVCVRSPHLALGYLDDPELTNARFVPNPFTGGARDRLYRTGDLGRYAANGEVLFLGRADDQVKVRGFRIELGEVQAHLAAAPGVREAIVLLRTDGPRGRRLAGYVVPEAGARSPSPGELRAHLQARLPGYMVPAGFVVLDRLPLTPNGKVDRRALARIDDGYREISMGSRPPQTRAERTIAAILGDMLGVDAVRVDDNFFDLGGNSLLLVQVHGRLEAELGRTIPMVALFNHPTVKSLAAFLFPEEERAGADPPGERKHRVSGQALVAGRNRIKDRRRRMGEEAAAAAPEPKETRS